MPAVARSQYAGDSITVPTPRAPTTGASMPRGGPAGTGSSGTTVTGTGPARTASKAAGSAAAFHSPTPWPASWLSASTMPAIVVMPAIRAYAAGWSRRTAASSVRGARATTCRPGVVSACRARKSEASSRTGVKGHAPRCGSPLSVSHPGAPVLRERDRVPAAGLDAAGDRHRRRLDGGEQVGQQLQPAGAGDHPGGRHGDAEDPHPRVPDQVGDRRQVVGREVGVDDDRDRVRGLRRGGRHPAGAAGLAVVVVRRRAAGRQQGHQQRGDERARSRDHQRTASPRRRPPAPPHPRRGAPYAGHGGARRRGRGR